MIDGYYPTDEILERYGELTVGNKQIVSKYLHIISEIQESGIVMRTEEHLEKAINKLCAEMPTCSFCGCKAEQAGNLFAGSDNVLICGKCVRDCYELLEEREKNAVWATAVVKEYSEMMCKHQEDYIPDQIANFDGYNLRQAFLRKAVLRGASFRQADLEEAKLMEADLRNADFTGASLAGADLKNARLCGAILTNVNLTGTCLDGADMTDVVF